MRPCLRSTWRSSPSAPWPGGPPVAYERWEPTLFKARVDEALRGFVAREADEFAAVDPVPGAGAGGREEAAAHGKRVRAAFCYWGWRAVGQPDSDALVRAAASMELVHA